jgi:hypothetical protein
MQSYSNGWREALDGVQLRARRLAARIELGIAVVEG